MVQIKMRPIFSRGNSVASISVAAPKQDDSDDNDDTTTTHDEREALTGSPSPRRSPVPRCRRRRRLLDADVHVDFSDVVTVHPPGDALTDKELKAYFYSVDDLKRFDRDRALTAMMYRSGKHPNGGDGPWDDNVHSIRGLEDYLGAVPSRSRDAVLSGGGLPTPSSPSSSSAVSFYRASLSCGTGTDRERERREHARAILMEQERLRTEGQDGWSDALVLQEVASKSSCDSRREAVERGRDDARAVSQASTADATTNVLRTVRGRLYALMEKQPSLRALASTDRQPSQRNLLSMDRQPSQRNLLSMDRQPSQRNLLSMDRQPSLLSLLGGGEKQPSIRNLGAAAVDKSP